MKTKFAITIMFSCFFCLNNYADIASADKINPDEIYKQGLSAYESNDFSKAITLFEMIVDNVPSGVNRDELVCMLRRSSSEINNFDKAVKYAKQCNESKYRKKITGKFSRIEQNNNKSSDDRRYSKNICLIIESNKTVCETFHLYTKIKINDMLIYDGPDENLPMSSSSEKINEIINEKLINDVIVDMYMSFGDTYSVDSINIHDGNHNMISNNNINETNYTKRADIKYDLRNKDQTISVVVVTVPNDYDLIDTTVVESIYMNAASLAVKKMMYTQYSYTKIFIYQNGNLAIESNTGTRTGESLAGAVETARQQERHYLKQQREKEAAEKMIMDRKAASKKLFDNFVSKNEVKEWVSKDKLYINPFLYEGKTVVTMAHFDRMLSATDGIFDTMAYPLVVSSIPRSYFSSQVDVLLAVDVIGNIETNIPMRGNTTVPHLKFVGAHQCQNESCDEVMLWTQKNN